MTRHALFLDHCAAWSGGEIALTRLVEALGDDIKAHVVLAEGGPLAARLSGSGVDVRVMALPSRTNRLDREGSARVPLRAMLDVLAYVVTLSRLMRRERPALVHANSLKSGIYGCLAARVAGVPVVWHVRDRVADDYLPRRLVRLVRGLLVVLPDAILVNSQATRETLGPWVRRAVPVTVLPDPYRPERPAAPRSQVRDPRAPVIALIGRLAPWKGQHVFIDALEALTSARPGLQGRLMGAALFGEDAYASDIARRISTSTADIRLSPFTGDVGEVLEEVDIVASASVIPEPFGQVVVEAMANGVPVVVPDIGGPAEIVHDGLSGLTYPPGDVLALCDRLQLLCRDEALYRRLAVNGLARAADFDPERIAERFALAVRVERLTALGRARRLLRAVRSPAPPGDARR